MMAVKVCIVGAPLVRVLLSFHLRVAPARSRE